MTGNPVTIFLNLPQGTGWDLLFGRSSRPVSTVDNLQFKKPREGFVLRSLFSIKPRIFIHGFHESTAFKTLYSRSSSEGNASVSTQKSLL